MIQYIDYHNFIADFSFNLFAKNRELGIFVWRLILCVCALYYANIAHKIISKKEDVNIISFFSISFLFTLILRIPLLGVGNISVDEAQAIASAARLAANGKMFIDVDGTTQGPMMLYILSLLPKLSIPLSYTSIRLFDIICLWFPSMILFYATLRHYTEKNIAILASIPFFLFAATLNMWPLTQFNTERIPFLFECISIFCLSLLYRKTNLTKSKEIIIITILGLSSCLMSLSKLQSGPLSLVFFIAAIWIFWKQKNTFLKISLFLIAIIIPIAFILINCYIDNSFEEMKIRFVETTLFYSKYGLNKTPTEVSLKSQVTAFITINLMNVNLSSFVLLYSIYLALLNKKTDKFKQILLQNKEMLSFFVISSIALIFLVSKPGNSFAHYGSYLIPYYFLILASIFIKLYPANTINKNFYYILFLPLIVVSIYGPISNKPFFKFINQPKTESDYYFEKNLKMNDMIAIWGWDNDLYLETSCLQATAISHSYYQIVPFKFREFYQRKYVEEIKRNRAKMFIDVVNDSAFTFNKVTEKHENFPIIKNFISQNFVYDTTVNGRRVYKSKFYFDK